MIIFFTSFLGLEIASLSVTHQTKAEIRFRLEKIQVVTDDREDTIDKLDRTCISSLDIKHFDF